MLLVIGGVLLLWVGLFLERATEPTEQLEVHGRDLRFEEYLMLLRWAELDRLRPTPTLTPEPVRVWPQEPVELRSLFVEAFGDRWRFAWCVWQAEGGNYGYVVSATNDYGPWQLHKARWPGDEGLYEVFISQGYTDPYDFGQSTTFVVRYTSINGWGAWVGARDC